MKINISRIPYSIFPLTFWFGGEKKQFWCLALCGCRGKLGIEREKVKLYRSRKKISKKNRKFWYGRARLFSARSTKICGDIVVSPHIYGRKSDGLHPGSSGSLLRHNRFLRL